MRKAMYQNGSPEPVFDFDEERTWFQVTLPVHIAFEQKLPFTTDLSEVQWNVQGIDSLLDQLVEYSGFYDERDVAGGIAGGIAGNQAEYTEYTDNQTEEIVKYAESNQVSTIAGGIAGGIADKFIKVLEMAREPISRKDILYRLSLVNNANNFETYIQPLVAINWLSMTLPDKPTSPNQQYLTTLKGRLLLAFLQHKDR